MPKTYSADIAERFWPKVLKCGKSGCWLWLAATHHLGYGVIGVGGGTQNGNARATHVSWLLTYGEQVPDGTFVLHKCDNPLCVKPEHLFLGDAKSNIQDAIAKGRHSGRPPHRPGALNGEAKLTWEQVREARRLHALGNTSLALSKQFGISTSQMLRIVNNESWRENVHV